MSRADGTTNGPDETSARWALHQGEVHLPRAGERLRLRTHALGEISVPSGLLAIGDTGPDVVVRVPPGTWRVVATCCGEPGEGWGVRTSHLSLLAEGRTEVRRGRLTSEHLDRRAVLARRTEDADPLIAVDSASCWCIDEEARKRCGDAEWRSPDCLNRDTEPAAGVEAVLDSPGAPVAAFSSTGFGDGLYEVFGGFDADGRVVAVHVDFGLTEDDEDPNSVSAILRRVHERDRRRALLRLAFGAAVVVALIVTAANC
jgi:hypothetical protein